MEIKKKIREWYLLNKRHLPWRETKDPYRIWISEIILQQTRVIQGMDYYKRFLERFPSLEILAGSDEQVVLKAWEGLGYYSRARNLHEAAKDIFHNMSGVFPGSYTGLMKLKGVGPYTAAAVSSIAFSEPRAVIDGNVHRVLSRLYGIEEPPTGYQPSSSILREAEKLLDREDPGTHNQALMELGALVCTPVRPNCMVCPVKEHCIAFIQNRTDELPLRSRPAKKRIRYFHYLLIRNENTIWLRKRNEKDIWKGLYEFPVIETADAVSTDLIIGSSDWSSILGVKGIRPVHVSEMPRHLLSHQEIRATFYHLPEDPRFTLSGYVRVKLTNLERYPVPRLIASYIDKLNESQPGQATPLQRQ